MNILDRPFGRLAALVSYVLGFFSLILSDISNSAFVTGCMLSFTWALFAYGYGLDLPDNLQSNRAGKAAAGFFLIVVGIVLAGISPNYLNAQVDSTEWLVMWGLLLGAQVGLSLLLSAPLKSLSFWCGYIVMAIILHSAIFRFPNEFIDIIGAKTLVLVALMISSWFLGIWLFFNNSDLDNFEETKKSKQAKSIIGVFSGLLTVIEFINIMYTMINFK